MTEHSSMLQRQRALLLVVLWLAFGLRFFRLDAQELRGDEAASWARITQEAGPIELLKRLVDEGQPHPPIHYWVLQAWERVLGDSEFALRSLSALLSVGVVALTYRVARQLQLGAAVALLAAAITAIQPYQIWLGQDAKNMYQLSLIGVLLATLCLPGLLRGERRAWVGYVLGGAFAMLNHYYALFGLLAHGAYVLFTPTAWRLRGRWVLAGVAVAALAAPWFLTVMPGLFARQFSFAQTAELPVGKFLSDTVGDAAVGPATSDGLGLIGAVLIGALLLIGSARLWAKRRAEVLMLTAWIVIAVAGTFVVTRVRPTYNTFYMSNAYPATYVLLAAALAGWRSRRAVWLTATGLVVMVFVVGLGNYYFDPRYSRSRGLRELAAELAADAQPNDVLITNYPDPATIYYLRSLTLPTTMLPTRRDFDANEVDTALDDLAARYTRLWHIPVRFAAWDVNGFVEARLTDRYVAAADWRFNRLRLRLFAPYPDQLPQYNPLGTIFSNGAELQGSYVTLDGDPDVARVEAGQWLRVSLWWTAHAPLALDYKVFVHALDINGQLVAQHDGMPHADAAPTSHWRSGQSIMDVHEFQVPPDAATVPVEIRVGMYDPRTGQRAQVAGGDAVVVWASAP